MFPLSVQQWVTGHRWEAGTRPGPVKDQHPEHLKR